MLASACSIFGANGDSENAVVRTFCSCASLSWVLNRQDKTTNSADGK